MWTIIKTYLASPSMLEVYKWIAMIGAVVAILFGAKNAGRTAEQLEQQKQKLKSLTKVSEINHAVDQQVDAMPDGAALNELRDKYSLRQDK